MPMNTVLVTGAAGFIGRSTIVELRRSAVSFVATDLHSHPDVPELLLGDLTDANFVAKLLGEYGVGSVIHLAGMLPTAARHDPITATRVNIDSSCALLERARNSGVTRFIFGSSLGVYGGRTGGNPVSEQTPAAPEELYGAGKLYVEHVGNMMQSEAFAFSALRIATVVGSGVRNSASPWRSEIFDALSSERPTVIAIPYSAEAVLPMIHVNDVGCVIGQMAIADPPLRGIFNSPAESMSVAQLGDLMSEINPVVKIKAGTRRETGIPAFMSFDKIAAALGYKARLLREHFIDGFNARPSAARRP